MEQLINSFHNQKIITPLSIVNNNNSNTPFRVMSLNVQGLNTTKQHFLLDMMNFNKIQILGVSETNLNEQSSKLIYKNNKQYASYFTSNSNQVRGSGTGIIIERQYNSYVRRHNCYKGRIIYIDMYMKGKYKLRIIQTYINANKKERTEIEDIFDFIIKTIKEGKQQNMKILLMGDFNINYEEYIAIKARNGTRWYYRLFQFLENNNIIDTIDIFNDTMDIHSYTPKQQGKNPSRIDYIWASSDLIRESLISKLMAIDIEHINTDHKGISVSFWPHKMFKKKQNAKTKQQKRMKTIYEYDKMEQEDWDNFVYLTTELVEKYDLLNASIKNTTELNQQWTKIQNAIIEAAEVIKSKEVNLNKYKDHHPIKNSKLHCNIRYITNLRINLYRTNKKQNMEKVNEKWKNTFKKLEEVMTEEEINMEWPYTIDASNIQQLLKQLKEVKNLLLFRYKKELNNYEQEQMIKFVNERCDNYEKDQKSMINSLTNREIKYITIDKIYKEIDGEDLLFTDEKSVKHLTNHHFQTIAGSVNQEKEIVGMWQDQYRPKKDIDGNIYNHLMDEPSWEEWIETIKNLPNGKAAGPSKISYEMIKHCSDEMQEVLYNFMCMCIRINNIPDAWRLAIIYPIPKPKPYDCNLINTRPITLLETPRKALISMLNRRFTKILVEKKVLKGNQFAGLPLQSTFEPIRILNEIIQDATENNKELWILSQDLAKAYDRVNIYMLKKAMDRLKIPQTFTKLILNLFNNRKNQVLTAVGTTDPYDVLIGIDQGEIISPILWCIYYDPLLCEIKNRHLGYNIIEKYKNNVYDRIYEEQKFQLSSMAYMDDTQWITENKEKLEEILKIADSFYLLNDIQVNKEKSELLLRKKINKTKKEKYDYNRKIQLKFGETTIDIKPKHPDESTRILGVWFNLSNKKDFVLQQAKYEVQNLSKMLFKKRVTDKHLLYIYNRLIIPRIEYWSQTTVLTKQECANIEKPFRRVFKNKLRLASTIPNAIFNNYIYPYRSIYEVQCQAKITNFLIQINDTSQLGDLTHLRLRNLQNKEWLENSLLVDFPYDKIIKKYKNNFIYNMLYVCKENNITFDIKEKLKTSLTGGNVSLKSIMDLKYYNAFKTRLKEESIFYLEQITSIDGKELLTWKDITNKKFMKKQRKPSKWYGWIKKKITHPNSYRLKNEFQTQYEFDLKGTLINNPKFDNQYPYVMFYDETYNTTITGKVYRKNQETKTMTINHYLVDLKNINEDNLIITKCHGCRLGQSNFDSCRITKNTEDIIIVNKKGKKFGQQKKRIDMLVNNNLRLAEIIYTYNRNRETYYKLEIERINKHNPLIKNNNDLIDRYFEFSNARNELYSIQRKFKESSKFEFFTDGSLIEVGSEYCSISSGFIQVGSNANYVEFSTTLEHWPSSAKGELMAIVCAIITVPNNSEIIIYTDSENTIKHFKKIEQTKFKLNPRQFFKQERNGIAWNILCEIILTKKINIELIKVKAHSNNVYNDYVDNLCKQAHTKDQFITIKNTQLENIRIVPRWNNIRIDQNLRQFLTLLSRFRGFEQFYNLNRNGKYRKNNIHWETTFNVLNYDIENYKTNIKSSNKKAQKIKLLFNELSTIEQMKKSFFELYENWLCPLCGTEEETFNHIWTCQEQEEVIDKAIISSQKFLFEELSKDNDKINFTDIKCLTDIWKNKQDDSSITYVDIIKGIIPLNLFELVNKYNNKQKTQNVLYKFRDFVYKITMEEIWKPRCRIMKDIEKEYNLDKKTKNKYKNKKSYIDINRIIDSSSIDNSLDSIRNYIYFGGNIIDYYNVS